MTHTAGLGYGALFDGNSPASKAWAKIGLGDGATLADRVGRTGYPFRAVAENLAAGYPDARSVVRGWVDSRSHRQNLLMRDARDAGIGLARDGRGALHWVLVLGAAQP